MLRPPPPPTTWRWVSSTRGVNASGFGTPAVAEVKSGDDEQMQTDDSSALGKGEVKMVIRFGAPQAALDAYALHPTAGKDERRGVQSVPCAVQGCERPFKYRLVSDFAKGACGFEHWKVLQGNA